MTIRVALALALGLMGCSEPPRAAPQTNSLLVAATSADRESRPRPTSPVAPVDCRREHRPTGYRLSEPAVAGCKRSTRLT